MTSKQKLFIDLIIPSFIAFNITILYLIIHKCLCKCNNITRKSTSNNKSLKSGSAGAIKSFSRKKRKQKKCYSQFINIFADGNYLSAFWRGMLISIGTIISVLFKSLACRNIGLYNGSSMYQFYFGYEKCFGVTWWISLVSLILILFIMLILFCVLYNMLPERRQHKGKNKLYKLVEPFKPEYWYYEFILLLRRCLIAGLIFLINKESSYFDLLLFIILCIFFGIQIWDQPYLYLRINKLETLCQFTTILAFAVLLMFNTSNNNENHYIFIQITIPLFVFFPWILLMYYFIKAILIRFGKCTPNMNDPEYQDIQYQKIKKRLLRTETPEISEVSKLKTISHQRNATSDSIFELELNTMNPYVSSQITKNNSNGNIKAYTTTHDNDTTMKIYITNDDTDDASL